MGSVNDTIKDGFCLVQQPCLHFYCIFRFTCQSIAYILYSLAHVLKQLLNLITVLINNLHYKPAYFSNCVKLILQAIAIIEMQGIQILHEYMTQLFTSFW